MSTMRYDHQDVGNTVTTEIPDLYQGEVGKLGPTQAGIAVPATNTDALNAFNDQREYHPF